MRYAMASIAVLAIACSAAAGDVWEIHVNSNHVTSVWVDGGTVYWGSTAGAVVFDTLTGAHSKILKSVGGLGSNAITAIARGDDGSLWMGTGGAGVSVLRGSDTWERHSTENLRLLSDETNDVSVNGPQMVVATSAGISLFDNGEFRTFFDGSDWGDPECSEALSIAINDEEVVVGAACGVFSYGITDRLWHEVVRGRSAQSIDYDGKNLFWIVAEDCVYTYDGSIAAVVPRTGIRFDDLYAVGAMDTTVWLMGSSGPARYDSQGQRWQRNREGLPTDLWDASSVFVVDDENVWIGTDGGVAVLTETGWVLHVSDGPAGNYVQDVEVDINGTLWFATGGRGAGGGDRMIGLLTFNGLEWGQIISPPLFNTNPYALDTNPVDGSLWVGFWGGGLMRHELGTETWESYNRMLTSGVVSALHIQPNGVALVGEYLQGLGVICPEGTSIHYTFDDQPPCVETKCVTALGPGRDGVMIGSYVSPVEGCLAKVVQLDVGDECSDKADDVCEIWGEKAGWVGGVAYAAATDMYGVDWFGTSGGLSSYDGEWHDVSGKIGAVWDIEVDAEGTKWVGTDLGLYVLEGYGTEWEDFEGRLRIYDSSNSPIDDSQVRALEFDAQGSLWIGMGGGGIYRLTSSRQRDLKRWVEVFPNPYYARQDTEGKGIRFSGLLPGREVRIYTIAGDLVAEIDHGQAWFGQNMSGEDVVPGVYIYHAYAESGGEFVGRLVIVK